MRPGGVAVRVLPHLEDVGEEHGSADDEGLPCLQPVHASVDVDGVGAEDGQQDDGGEVPAVQVHQVAPMPHVHRHAHALQGAGKRRQLTLPHQQAAQRQGDADARRSSVHDHKRQRRDEGHDELVPPLQVDNIIHKPKQHDDSDG